MDKLCQAHKDEGLVEALMPLNTFANICGHFFNACQTAGYEDAPCVNNGYNCGHPQCEDEEEGIGKCLASCCPLCYPADGGDCKAFGRTCENCPDVGCEECECEDDYVVATIPKHLFNERSMYLRPQENKD